MLLLDNELLTIAEEEGIVMLTFKSEIVNLETALKISEHRKIATLGMTYPMLTNITSVKNSTKEARDFFAAGKHCDEIRASAILINSIVGSMIGNFFILINKPAKPTKLFTNEYEAKKWLATYKIFQLETVS